MNQRPKIAVIGSNSLMNIGLKAVVERIIPMVEVCCFASAEDVVAQPDGEFFHFFISAQICQLIMALAFSHMRFST